MNNFQKVKIAELGKIITGKTPKTSDKNNFGGNTFFLTPSDNMNGKYIYKTKRYVSDKGKSTLKNIILPKDSICVSCIGSDLGKVVLTTGETITNQQINSIIVDSSKFDVNYIYYSATILGKILNYHSKTSTAVPIINKTKFSNYTISCPNLPTQKKIASILSALDDKIELNNKINENLLQIGSLIFKKYYELGKLETLESIINIIESGSREKGGAIVRGIPSIGAEKIERFGIYDYSKEKFISKKYFNNLKKGIIKSGDILLYKDGAYTGKSTMALNNYPYKTCAINEHVFILRTINNFAQFYLYFCISKEEIKSQIFSLASSKAAQPGLNQKELFSVKAKIPTKKLIYEFEKIVEPLMNMISENSLESNKLKQLRDTLLPKLMSGELDVSNLDI